MTRWTVVGVESSVPWPTEETEVEFRGSKLLLRPETDDHLASVAMEHPTSVSLDEALVVIRHYLSSLSWVEQAGIKEVAVTGGSAPFFLGRGRGRIVTQHFGHDYLPDPSDPEVRLALALYREGMSEDPTAYRFLSFFKIINILHATGKPQKAWINDNLPLIRDAQASRRVTELSQTVGDVGAYLYESGRCAVAHAFSQPLVDPENTEDSRRLAADLPVMQALAEVLIEHELGLKSRHTVWRDHLYHLEGFRDLLGEELVVRLNAREEVDRSEIPTLPTLSIGVRDKPPLESLVGMSPTVVAVENGTIWLRCDSANGTAQLLLGLAVAEEYLLFNPEEHVAVSATNSRDALSSRRDHMILLRDLLLNGQLEILSSVDETRLGRTDAYMGQNIDMATTLSNLELIIQEIDESLEQLQDQGKD